MQSARERERRPVWLKSAAAVSASAPEKASTDVKIFRETSSSRFDIGPHLNSAQAMAEMPMASCDLSHCSSIRSCVDPVFKADIKKFVSTCIIATAYRRASRTVSIQAFALASSRLKLLLSSLNASNGLNL